MEFVMGELLGIGAIGIMYTSDLGGIAAYAIVIIILLLTLIGLFTILKWIFTRKRKNKRSSEETPGQKWLRTGRTN